MDFVPQVIKVFFLQWEQNNHQCVSFEKSEQIWICFYQSLNIISPDSVMIFTLLFLLWHLNRQQNNSRDILSFIYSDSSGLKFNKKARIIDFPMFNLSVIDAFYLQIFTPLRFHQNTTSQSLYALLKWIKKSLVSSSS